MRHPRAFSLATLCLWLALLGAGCNDDRDQAAFTAALSGSNEVPANTSAASGSVTFSFDGDSSVQFRVDLHSITEVTAAHIHSGALGLSGSIRVTLFDGPSTGALDGQLVQGSFGPKDLDEQITMSTLLDEMRNGKAYVNVITTAHPEGEIRGQIRLAE